MPQTLSSLKYLTNMNFLLWFLILLSQGLRERLPTMGKFWKRSGTIPTHRWVSVKVWGNTLWLWLYSPNPKCYCIKCSLWLQLGNTHSPLGSFTLRADPAKPLIGGCLLHGRASAHCNSSCYIHTSGFHCLELSVVLPSHCPPMPRLPLYTGYCVWYSGARRPPLSR